MLSRELKALTESGLIDRKDHGVVPPKVDYRLTPKGQGLGLYPGDQAPRPKSEGFADHRWGDQECRHL